METATAAWLRDAFGGGLTNEQMAAVAALARVVDVPDGAILLAEGRPCADMGILTSGRVALRLASPGSTDRTIMTLEPGEIFGWSAIVPPGLSTSTCVAIAPSSAILLDGVALGTLLDRDASLAAAMYRRLVATVSRRLSATRLQLLDLYAVAGQPW